MRTSSKPHPAPHPDAEPQPAALSPAAISRSARLALWDDNTTSPISDWIDHHGDLSTPEAAVACVLEHPVTGQWIAVDLDHYETASLH